MSHTLSGRLCAFSVGIIALLLPSTAGAAGFGGVAAHGKVKVSDVVCVKRCVGTHKATPGAMVKIRGLAMEQVSHVVFRGASGPVAVAPRRSTEHAAIAEVPAEALSSRLFVVDSSGRNSGRSRHKLLVLSRDAIPSAVYPIRGANRLWDGFGGARRHQGVDLGAACGTRLVAALPGRVSTSEFHGRAGNYLVIDAEGTNAEIIYMHMRSLSPLKVGQSVEAGQTVGFVGDSGNASGCHLHFEYWLGTAWRGGEAVDPMPYLRDWKGSSRGPVGPASSGRAYIRD